MNSELNPLPQEIPAGTEDWKGIVTPFQKASLWRASWQLVNSLGPYFLLWVAMYWALQVSVWLVVPLAVLAGAVLVRIFIIFHDCGHGSFFRSRLANDITGFITGLLTLTPYHHWRWEHSLHHATSGNLDKRGTGDVWTMTVQEYLESPRRTRFAYRLARNPVVLFLIAPVGLFTVWQRIPTSKASRREKASVWWMNLAIAGMVVGLSWLYGFVPYLIIQLTITTVGGAAGVWMFYVQHQFEDAYWERREDWDYMTAALQGSSFYKLPRVLQWLSGNIGFHHIHHLSSRIPNYNLERCHNSHPLFLQVKPVTLRTSLNCINYRLWDEGNRKLVGFEHVRNLRRKSRHPSVEASASRDQKSV